MLHVHRDLMFRLSLLPVNPYPEIYKIKLQKHYWCITVFLITCTNRHVLSCMEKIESGRIFITWFEKVSIRPENSTREILDELDNGK